MKKFVSMVLVLMMVLLAAVTAFATENSLEKVLNAGKLVVATSPDYAPYEFLNLETGEPVGADIELAKYIAQKLGVELEVLPLDFDTVLAAVTNGSCDMAVAGMVPKDERKTMMDFTDIYYNDGPQYILIQKKNADTLKTLADLKGKTVAAQNGTLQVELTATQTEANIEYIVSVNTGVMMLMTGKVDGIALASVVAEQYVKNYPDDLAILEQAYEYTPLGVAAAMPKGRPELLAAVNEVIAEVMESGIYFTWIDEANAFNNSQSAL